MNSSRKSVTSIASVFIVLGLVMSCVTVTQNQRAGPIGTDNFDDENNVVVEEGEVEIVESNEPISIPAFDFLEGGVSYKIDDSNSVELLIDANATQEQTLSLNTDDGLIWTLTVPPQAVTENVLIRMSSLQDIESESLGSLKTGLLLEPDGLEFSSPVKLDIKGDGLGAHPVIFNGSHDGSEFDFANVTLMEGGASAAITHFSSAFADPLANDKQYTKAQRAASDSYKRIRDFALSFLKEKVYVPTPPAIPLRCASSEDIQKQRDQALKVFLEEFSMPEEALINMVLTAGRNDALLNMRNNDGIEIARMLQERLMKKGNTLYKAYYPQEDYFLAVSNAGLTADRQLQLLGGSSEPESFIAKTGRWARKIADEQLIALREKHDYQVITTLIGMDRQATALGNSKANSLAEIEKAFQFMIQYDLQVNLDLEVGDETISTQGTGNYNAAQFSNPSYYQSGKGQYVGFEASLPDGMQASLNMPATYAFDTRIEKFDACREFSFDLIINKFSDDTETYTYSDGDFEVSQTEGIVAAIVYSAFENEVIETMPGREGETFYKFTIPLQNLNATAGEMQIARTIPNSSATLTLKLVHTPK